MSGINFLSYFQKNMSETIFRHVSVWNFQTYMSLSGNISRHIWDIYFWNYIAHILFYQVWVIYNHQYQPNSIFCIRRLFKICVRGVFLKSFLTFPWHLLILEVPWHFQKFIFFPGFPAVLRTLLPLGWPHYPDSKKIITPFLSPPWRQKMTAPWIKIINDIYMYPKFKDIIGLE